MDREKALEIVRSKIGNENLIKHMLAVEACMKSLADHFGKDSEKWGLTGILHDVDYEDTQDNPEKHGIEGAKFLENYDLEEDILHAIRTHAGHEEPESKMDFALLTSDALSGLIVAGALVNPEGLRGVDTDFILRRFDENSFARGADRDTIRMCSEMGLELDEFISICLDGMKQITDVLGL